MVDLVANDSTNPGKLRIAIVGAGLVGSAALLALSRLQDVEVVGFEKSPAPREAGAWISLTVTGQLVLTKLISPEKINEIVYRPPDRAVYVTRHWRTGEDLVRSYSSEHIKEDFIQARTHRWPLLKLLTDHHPKDAVQYGKQVTGVRTSEVGAKLEFANGRTTSDFDLVVAADGIYSGIRRQYWPDHHVQFKGAVAYRNVFHKSRVAHIKELHDDSSSWRRDGEVVFLSELGLDQYGVVIIKTEELDYAATLRWERSISQEGLNRLRDHYKDWDPVISKVLDTVEDIQAYPLDTGPWLRELTREDRVVFIGDASHPTAGAYGAGAAMGFGDAWALYRSLELTRRRGRQETAGYDLHKALQVFQQTRAPFLLRVEQQIALDRDTAKYLAEAAGDEDEWKRRFKESGASIRWLQEHDVELEVLKAASTVGVWKT
ncbi:unnamed protein product [Clonostachys rhizophaga]|uniref:FAD-binding domain-containing protein n=1 Tax=Clonostachys rhizophaga TaxID=160324 RepID=A0A9N9VZS9_9HYPO|nr:unnamed protein product [Clonostachys rhizophaga]